MKRTILILSLALVAVAILANAQQKFSREQAIADLDSMVYVLNEVHPNMFTVINMGEFMERVEKIKKEMSDSLTRVQIYERIAPLATAIGDGHTTLYAPQKDIYDKGRIKRIPITFKIDQNDSTVTIKESIAPNLPTGAKILSINGTETKGIVDWMMKYSSGERTFFRLSSLDEFWFFDALFHMRHQAEKYTVRFIHKGKVKEKTVESIANKDFNEILDKAKFGKEEEKKPQLPYYYEIAKDGTYAVFYYNSCKAPEKMSALVDSMISDLRSQNIRNLIIDLRHNGGGNSQVNDEFFKRLHSKPFHQFGKTYTRITPTTLSLMGEKYIKAYGEYYGAEPKCGIYFDNEEEKLIEPVSDPEKRFDGDLYLLISHEVFSSACDFSWRFKQDKLGTVIGEETGGMGVSFGDVLTYKLPNTRLTLQLSYKRFWQYGADECDIHGTLPDYEVPHSDALDFAIKLIKNNKQ